MGKTCCVRVEISLDEWRTGRKEGAKNVVKIIDIVSYALKVDVMCVLNLFQVIKHISTGLCA